MMAQVPMRVLVVVCMCISIMTALPVSVGAVEEAQGKDLCLLYRENCPDRKESITEIIEHLKREIERGEAIYTKEELARLQRKLDEYEWLLYSILNSPSR